MAKLKIKTTTNPVAIPIKDACRISNRNHSQILYNIAMGVLDHGFAFNKESHHGQKLVVLNHKWNNWVKRRKELDFKKNNNINVKNRNSINTEQENTDLNFSEIAAKPVPTKQYKIKLKIKSVKTVIPKIPPLEEYLL